MYSKSLSYSGLSLYKKCPKSWKHSYIDGHRSPPGRAAQRGTRLHQLLENYFNGEIYPDRNTVLKPWEEYMAHLVTFDPSPEAELAVKEDWTPTSFKDPEANLRGALDLRLTKGDTLHVFDWKSGRVYDDHVNQANTYAALSLCNEPEADKVEVTFVYLDHDHTETWMYSKDKVEEIKGELEEIIAVVRSDEEFLATPSDSSCMWCPLSWRRGGQCHGAP